MLLTEVGLTKHYTLTYTLSPTLNNKMSSSDFTEANLVESCKSVFLSLVLLSSDLVSGDRS